MARPPRTKTVDARMLESLGLTAEEIAGLSEKERAYAVQCLEEMADTGTSPTAAALLLEDYKWEPVSMERFIADSYYMGELTKDLYPAVRAALIESFDGQTKASEQILAGSIGWGKSTMAAVIMAYLSYRLSCLRDPHSYYRLMPGAPIIGGIYSISLEQALATMYGKLLNWFDSIPYFLQKCPRVKRVNSVIKFRDSPLQIIAGSNELHTIGRDLLFFVMDEANFLQGPTGKSEEGVALNLYTNAARRVKSRFLTTSGEPAGMVILASSKKTKASFLENHVKEAKDDIRAGKTKLWSFAQWEVKPASLWKKPRFTVEIGDRMFPSRILREGESPRVGSDTICVPGEFAEEFNKDIDKALRDLAGVASESMMPLFHDKTVIHSACCANWNHPFTREQITLDINNDLGIDTYFRPDQMFRVVKSKYEMKMNPGHPRYLHVDIGLTGDSLGMCMVHMAGYRTVRRPRKDGTYYEDSAPVIHVDFILRVRPPRGSEIDLAKARGFIISLADMSCPIKIVSYDSYNSRDSVQTLKKLGIGAVEVSVDKTDIAYLALRQAFIENRVVMYKYPHLITELSELERDIDKRKVDHPERSSTTGEAGCFAGDTKIRLLSGQSKTLKELAESGEDVYVYTVKDGEVSHGLGVKPRLTAKSAKVVRVTLDDGASVRCTPDHRFMLRDGTYREAKDLKAGDSLMPLYTRVSSGEMIGYEQYLGLSDGRWHFTHRTVGKTMDGRYTGNQHGGRIVHHVAGKRNNDPRFLSIMTPAEHSQMHAVDLLKRRADPAMEAKRVANHLKYARSPAARKAQSARMSALFDRPEFCEAQRERAAKLGKVTGPLNITKYNKSDKHRRVASETGKRTIWSAIAAIPRCEVTGDDLIAYAGQNPGAVIWDAVDRFSASEGTIRARLQATPEGRSVLEQWKKTANRLGGEKAQRHLSRDELMRVLSSSASSVAACAVLTTSSATLKKMCERAGIPDVYAELCQRGAASSHRRPARPRKYDAAYIQRCRRDGEGAYAIAKRLDIPPQTVYAYLKISVPNHKVASVVPAGTCDVYDISVPGTENFALDCGVFVHNSKDVADALCGAVFNASSDKTAFLLMGVPHLDPIRNAETAVEVPGGSILWRNLDKGLG